MVSSAPSASLEEEAAWSCGELPGATGAGRPWDEMGVWVGGSPPGADLGELTGTLGALSRVS